MDNLISRQAAIDALGDMVMNWTDSDYELGQLNQWKEDRKAIIDLPSAQPQWIPVSERLPERNGRYLVTRGNDAGAFWNRVYIVNYSDLMGLNKEKHWWTGDVGKSNFERILDVLAWMPLPEPYEE